LEDNKVGNIAHLKTKKRQWATTTTTTITTRATHLECVYADRSACKKPGASHESGAGTPKAQNGSSSPNTASNVVRLDGRREGKEKA
jgi:hypothetical protein